MSRLVEPTKSKECECDNKHCGHKIQWLQLLLQLHDKQMVTTEEVRKAFGFNEPFEENK